jgi:hypothetical protein
LGASTSLYASRLTAALPSGLPTAVTRTAHHSVGAALGVASVLGHAGHVALGLGVHHAATSAFFHGFSAANLVAAGVAAVGAVIALAWLPAQPTTQPVGGADARNLAVATGTPALD